jgi:hypothetical protein
MRSILLIALSLLPLQAGTLSFSLDTSTLDGLFAPGQAVTAVFQLTSITPGTTTVEVGSFSPVGTPTTVTLQDNNFFNEASIDFTMGSTLSFIASFTSLMIDPDPSPDGFAFYLRDINGDPLFTDDPNGIFLFVLSIDDLNVPTLDIYNAFDGQFNPIGPQVSFTPSNAVPEPASGLAVLAALGAVIQWRRHDQKQGRRTGELSGTTRDPRV